MTANTSSNIAPPYSLNMEKMLEAIRKLEALKPDGIDLYGHDLGDYAFELKVPKELDVFNRHKDRRAVIVPRSQLDSIYHTLRAAGADVRLEPRYGAPRSETEGKPNV